MIKAVKRGADIGIGIEHALYYAYELDAISEPVRNSLALGLA